MSGCECCEASCKEIRVSFCPECKSRSVGYVFRLGNLFGAIPKMSCRNCGFESSVFPVLVVDETELKKAADKKKNSTRMNTDEHGQVKRKKVAKKKTTKKKVVKKSGGKRK